MFSLKVVDTDMFLDMSASAQNLYFHLGMRADDDGFVSSPKKIMTMANASDDDMTVLVAKGFIIKMATNGVSVVTHWHTNNLIRPDRYQETEYKEEKKRLEIKDGKYIQEFGIPNVIPKVNQPRTQYRLGKDRLGKDTNTPEPSSVEIEQIIKAFEEVDPKNKTYYGNTTQRKACKFLLSEYGLPRTLEVVSALPKINTLNIYVAQITTPDELMKNWAKLKNAYDKKKLELNTKGRGLEI